MGHIPVPRRGSKSHPVRPTINGERRHVGNIKGDTFITYRTHEEDHFMRKYSGFGINYKVLTRVLMGKVEKIKLIYERKDGGEDMYISSPENWAENGTTAKEGGFEKQVFLSVHDFDKKLTAGGR